MTKKQKAKGKQKTFAKKRTANPTPGQGPQTGEGFQQQDPKRRLGNFETAGEHARTGTRNK